NYVVRTAPNTRFREHAFWRTCSKCHLLMRLASESGTVENSCAAGGKHTPQGQFFLSDFHNAWRWCRKCQVLAAWDGGVCPADGGTHDQSQSDVYQPPSFQEECVVVVAADLIAGQSFANAAGTVVVTAIALGSDATVRLT